MLKNLFLILYFLSFTQLYAQGEANIWYFGENAGIDFNSGSPVTLTNGQLNTTEGCATISDSNGNLLFYTDGLTVYNQNHTIMLNGTNLNGHPSSTQSAIIVPKPEDTNIYYIFTTDAFGASSGLQYSEVDMSLDSGLGGVTSSKNILLHTPSTEKITAIKHSNGRDIWVVAHRFGSNEFTSYLISNMGLNINPVISTLGFNPINVFDNIGCIKLSPDGSKLAIVYSNSKLLELFEFDNSAGTLSNPIQISGLLPSGDVNSRMYGVEFSPNGQFIYISENIDGVFQFSLSNYNQTAILASKIQIIPDNLPTIDEPHYTLQLGPDSKIYVAHFEYEYLGVIHNPNVQGIGCNYQFDGVFLEGKRSLVGLPPFIQSYFNVSIAYNNVCLGESTDFSLTNTVDSVTWDFGDPTSGANNTSTSMTPSHVFTSVGTYTVTATAISGSENAISTVEVVISEVPIATQPQNMSHCDTNDDGFYTFDLSTQDTDILNVQSSATFEVIYYASMVDYTANTPIPDKTAYPNTTAYGLQTIIASVVNKDNNNCEDSTSFTIQVFESPTPSLTVPDLIFCDNTSVGTITDGMIEFDLTLRESDILNGQSSSNFTVRYYTDTARLNEITNQTAYPNVSSPQTIYVSVENGTNTTCKENTSFTLIVSEQPTATQPQNILQCDTDANNDGFYAFDLSTQDSDILNGQSSAIFEVIYYASMADYNTNTPVPDKTAYTNTIAYDEQTIIASVVNKNNNDCEDFTSFTIQVFEMPTPSLTVPPLTFCDNISVGTDIDGIVEFDLTLRENDILNGQSNTDFTVRYYTDMARLNEITNQTAYPNISRQQTIYVTVENILNLLCVEETSFEIEVFEKPTVTPIVELKQCDDDTDGVSLFNLEEVIDEITTNASIETITFHETPTDATLGNSPIPNTTAYPNDTPSTDTVWARIVNGNDCTRTSQVNLIVSTTEIPLTFATRNFYKCDDAIAGTITDGISSFDFSSVTTEIEALFPVGQQLVITYYRNLADALAESNPITDITNYRNIGYPNTQNIYIRVDSLLDNDCLGLGSHITLHVETIPVANPITLDDECDDDGDGMFGFDTSNFESTIIGSQSDVNVFYTDGNGDALPNPLPNPFLTGTQTITVRVENALSQDSDGACYDETTISFSVDAAAVANTISDQIECDDDTDGFFSFDTSTIEATVLNGQTGMLVSYTDSNGDALPSPLPNPFLTDNETITVRVENPLNNICFDEITFEFIVRERPEFELIDEDVICINNSPTLDITTYNPNDVYTYNWTGPNGFTDTGASTTVSEGGIYTVIATSIFNCDSFPQQITINESELATITLDMITIVDDSTNNTVTIDTTNLGFGDYEFSLDDEFNNYQDSPIFENVSAGIHIIYVRDKNDCGTTPIEISVIGFPNFFTPNNDGTNDTWNVLGINNNFYTNSVIHIFDRFGKIIAIVDPTSDGWDGLYNGKEMFETDYWFSVQLIDNDGNIRERKGHFSLIRR